MAEMGPLAGICIDSSDNLYICDQNNNVIRKVVISTGIITTVAGHHAFGAGYSGDGGQATMAEICGPSGVTTDLQGNIYIADQCNEVIRKVSISSGMISTVAGNNSYSFGFSGDGGPATLAELRTPWDLCVDNAGNIYIADCGNTMIRKVDATGIINAFAGNYIYGAGYSGDGGPATAAELNQPRGPILDNFGNMYIPDLVNNVVRMVNSSENISTVAGNFAFGAGYSGDGGPATLAEMHYPNTVRLDKQGDLYINDGWNYVVRKVSGVATAVNELTANDEKISLYPNPSNGVFTMQLAVGSWL